MLTMCVLLWANPGGRDDLTAYESAVLRIVEEHSGRVVTRMQTDESDNGPDEIQVLQFPNDEALARYMADDRRTELANERDRVVARTERIDGHLLGATQPHQP